ncbi:phytoene desaturase [Candidatus Uhrbacteria bacterium]|nr:phytoene desaturase [Candidatus Uhrbacteria bacterium]MBD3283845.1 phytoene desaturase [Candidatus Uhrbacteria bacterium]
MPLSLSLRNMNAIIIGSGFGGLGAAGLLAKKGYEVHVFEKNEQPGGRASVLHKDGFTFDMGPSWYLMPDIFEDFYRLLGERVEDHLTLHRLDPSYRVFFPNREPLDLSSDIEKTAVLFERLEPGAGERFRAYLTKSEKQYHIAVNKFLYKNYDTVFDFFTKETMTEGRKLKVFSNMQRYVERHFKHDILQKILQYTLVFLGGSPYNTPALYNIMSHIDFNMGVFYPEGGIARVVESLVQIAEKNGAQFHYNAPVRSILVEDRNAVGVKLENGETHRADIVISNAEVAYTEQHLLDPSQRMYSDRYWKNRTLAPSAFLLYLGVKGELPNTLHHNLYFCKDWQKNFREIFDDPRWPEDPSIYISVTSKTDPNVAPEGHENLVILVPISPKLDDHEEARKQFRDQIIQKVSSILKVPDLKCRIISETMFVTKDFELRYNAQGGSALGLAHTLFQTAIFRPNNINKKVKNLFYVGSSTNPGIGMPICLISAELLIKRLTHDRSFEKLPSL